MSTTKCHESLWSGFGSCLEKAQPPVLFCFLFVGFIRAVLCLDLAIKCLDLGASLCTSMKAIGNPRVFLLLTSETSTAPMDRPCQPGGVACFQGMAPGPEWSFPGISSTFLSLLLSAKTCPCLSSCLGDWGSEEPS